MNNGETKDCTQTVHYNGVDLVLNFAVRAVKKCLLSVIPGVRYNGVFLTENVSPFRLDL